jgi:hypothetical protein
VDFSFEKYNQYTLCRLKVLAKWLKICRVMIKRVLIFLEGIVCKHLLVWAFKVKEHPFIAVLYFIVKDTVWSRKVIPIIRNFP